MAERNLLKIEVTLGDEVYSEDLSSQLVSPNDLDGLNEALVNLPGKFAWWAVVESRAAAIVDQLERQLELRKAQLFINFERDLTATEGKKPTIDKIKASVRSAGVVQNLETDLEKASLALAQVKVGRQTLQMQKDCLLEVARNFRSEMEYGLTVPGTKQPSKSKRERILDKAKRDVKDVIRKQKEKKGK